MKFLFSHNDKKTEFKADYGQLFNYFKNTPKEEIIASFDKPHNRNLAADKCLNDDENSWKGGPYQDLFKDVIVDTKKHLDAKSQQGFVNKRKRFLSEHDGDYVHDRRYDINFMESARREKVQGSNLIKINAVGGFRANVDQKDINEFAKQVCEVVNYFEATGKNVELNLFYKKEQSYYGAPVITTFITVKQSDKYLSKSDIYRAFSSMFFRYIGLCTTVAVSELCGKECSTGVGSSVFGDRIEVTDSEITIHGMTKNLMERIKNETNN